MQEARTGMVTSKNEMTAGDVVDLCKKLDYAGIAIWVDGGWAVDALLGKETRLHKDLDIVIQQKDVPKLRELLEAQGYKDVQRDDTSSWNFVLGDDQGHEIDMHVVVFDEKRNGILGPVENGSVYPANSLSGTGTIAGQKVRCVSAEYMVKFISPWLHKLRDKDFQDVLALCEKFGIEYPEEYFRFKKSN